MSETDVPGLSERDSAELDVLGFTGPVLVGMGGLGRVYRATRRSTGTFAAIKVLSGVDDLDTNWLRARRELEALASLKGHSNVIQIEEILDLTTGPALVMEFAPGGSLTEYMRAGRGALSVPEALFVGQEVSEVLRTAHKLGLTHRDIKPQNLLLTSFGQVKVCDFGISALNWSDQFKERTASLSYRYASPEELDGDVEVGTSTDVFSLGATLVHCLTGRPPSFSDRDDTGTYNLRQVAAVMHEHPSIRDDLISLLRRCLATRPDRRPPAPELLDSLTDIASRLPIRVRRLPIESRSEGSFDRSAQPADVCREADDDITVERTRPTSTTDGVDCTDESSVQNEPAGDAALHATANEVLEWPSGVSEPHVTGDVSVMSAHDREAQPSRTRGRRGTPLLAACAAASVVIAVLLAQLARSDVEVLSGAPGPPSPTTSVAEPALESQSISWAPFKYADGTVVTRTWTINRDQTSLTGELTVSAPSQRSPRVIHVEVIPKSLAKSVDDIEFDVAPTNVLDTDPIVAFSLTEMEPGSTSTITYRIAVEITDAELQLATWRADHDRDDRSFASPVASLTIRPNAIEMAAGERISLRIAGRLFNGETITKRRLRQIVWQSSNDAVVRISRPGQVEAVAGGQARITATLDGVKTRIRVLVTPAPTTTTTPPTTIAPSTSVPGPSPTRTTVPVQTTTGPVATQPTTTQPTTTQPTTTLPPGPTLPPDSTAVPTLPRSPDS